jgi:hypothetical protein
LKRGKAKFREIQTENCSILIGNGSFFFFLLIIGRKVKRTIRKDLILETRREKEQEDQLFCSFSTSDMVTASFICMGLSAELKKSSAPMCISEPFDAWPPRKVQEFKVKQTDLRELEDENSTDQKAAHHTHASAFKQSSQQLPIRLRHSRSRRSVEQN